MLLMTYSEDLLNPAREAQPLDKTSIVLRRRLVIGSYRSIRQPSSRLLRIREHMCWTWLGSKTLESFAEHPRFTSQSIMTEDSIYPDYKIRSYLTPNRSQEPRSHGFHF